MTTFCGVMDFPLPVTEKSYNNIINKLDLCSKEVAEASMQSAALEEITLSNSPDIVNSGDGTRGYSFRVDVCCHRGKNRKGCVPCLLTLRDGILGNGKTYKKWKILHVQECLKNYNVSAGMRETGKGSYISALSKSSFCEVYILQRGW
ncbi:hypothetical protein TNCV_1198101 [Trichonephila clavipes]|uniref:Uncharacterized protein n=1 Tax=Trichonephila clavipes TaxID=2585209 RepID=A0A8X6S706_TRICX|nr:hypothetical protein TNCV_1198101 [Trichonephila clavipes]